LGEAGSPHGIDDLKQAAPPLFGMWSCRHCQPLYVSSAGAYLVSPPAIAGRYETHQRFPATLVQNMPTVVRFVPVSFLFTLVGNAEATRGRLPSLLGAGT
jgi:hypothetical protein